MSRLKRLPLSGRHFFVSRNPLRARAVLNPNSEVSVGAMCIL
jgi:hypothetical protein